MGRIWTVIAVAIWSVAIAGCGEDEIQRSVADDCPGDECVECDDHVDCTGGTFCHGTEGVCVEIDCDGAEDCPDGTRCSEQSDSCIGDVCEPGEQECTDGGDALAICNDDGTGYDNVQECPSGNCSFGSCQCVDGDDCFDGELCTDTGVCDCPSQTYCGDELICCGSDEVCEDSEDEDGGGPQCVPECPGERCGFDGDLCCEGDTPVCGPGGECAPSCEDQGELCGEDFDECCAVGDVCVFGDCVEPGDECSDFTDCDFGEYCDDGIGRCLPDDFPDDLVCEAEQDFDPFDIEDLWHWEGVEIGDRHYRNVQSIPVTADMTDDGTPDVVITPYHDDDQHNGILVVIDGESGDTAYYNEQRTFSGQGHSAVADVTGDGRPEIVSILGHGDGGVAMIENPANCSDPEGDDEDCIRWEFSQGTLDRNSDGMAPLIADINGDDSAEVVVGTTVIDGDSGDLIADGTTSSRGYNGPHENWGASSVADLDGSGSQELLTGDCAWKVDFDDGELDEYWCNDEFNNGMVGVADIAATDGRDGLPEVVTVRSGRIYVLDGQSGDSLYDIAIPGGGAGGAPNIADFDGDGTNEIGLPGEQCYSVFDLDCLDGSEEPGECEQPQFPDCTPGVDCLVDPCDAGGLSDGSGDGVLWSVEVQDRSEATGSSVFDFQGNERNEVVYNDECRLLVLDGQTGQPLISRLNTTRTATEYPLVVDVNGDGRSNIAMIANNDQYNRDCADFLDIDNPTRPDWFPECFPDDGDDRPDECDTGTSGIIVMQDEHDAWVSTRSIWNQHAYHITNIDDDGTLPASTDFWNSHNTFRANQQGEIPLNAPDVVISNVQVDAVACPPDITLQATIQNQGMAAIPEGMPVSLYLFESSASSGELIETATIDQAISPGGVAQVEFSYDVAFSQFNNELDFQIVANDDGDDGEPVRDCNPDEAMSLIEGVVCTYAG